MLIGTDILVRSIIAGVLLVAVIFAVAWYLPKINRREKQELGTQWDGKIKAIEAKKPTIAEWLENVVLRGDIDSLQSRVGRRVYSLHKDASFEGIAKSEPYIELSKHVLNTAVFPLLVEGVGGILEIEGEPCVLPIELVKEGEPTLMKHAECEWISIRQKFTTKEKADEIIKKGRENKRIRVNFNNCYLTVRPQIPGKHLESINVSLGENIESIDYVAP